MDKYNISAKLIIITLPAIAIISLIMTVLFKQYNLFILGSYLAIPMILAPVIFKYTNDKNRQKILLNKSCFMIAIIIYFLFYGISLVLLKSFDTRPLSYYLLLSLMATIILIEILLFNESVNKTRIILLQIMILLLNVLWGVNLKYYFYIERTDPIVHTWYIKNLIASGYVTSVFEIYQSFPLWHILCSIVNNIINLSLPIHKIMFINNGIIYLFIAPLVYVFSNFVFKKTKISLLISLFACLNPFIIIYGMSSIPRSVASFLEILLLVLLLDSVHTKKRALSIFVVFAITLYHTVSMPFILILLLIIYTAFQFYSPNENNFLTLDYLFLAFLIMFTYWIYQADILFQNVLNSIANPPPIGLPTKSIILAPLNEVFNYLHYSPLLFFMIYGCLFSFKNKQFSALSKILIFTGLLTAAVAFPGPSLLLTKLAKNFNLLRFGEYAFIFISLAAAIGLLGIFDDAKNHGKFIVISVFFCMCFLTFSNDFTASDNPLIKRPFYTFYLKKAEIISFESIANVSDLLMCDYVALRYLTNSPHGPRSHIMEVNNKSLNFLRGSNHDVLLIREKEWEKRPLRFYTTNYFISEPSWGSDNSLEYYHNNSTLMNLLNSHVKFYDSKYVSAFI